MLIRQFQPLDQDVVTLLWSKCDLIRPWNDPAKDIRRKLRVNPELFLIGELDGNIIATIMAGYESHRGWINYLAVAPEHQRHGHGREILAHAERLLLAAGCPKINLQIRETNSAVTEFYKALGYTIDDVVSMGKRLDHDE
jgi:ribosomal protein S18 acetylase RimI-like enzyme